jgi:hypothetical protein
MSKVEDEVCELIQTRTKVGLKTYGVTMEREDFTHLDWLTYLQEELMDAVIYLQRLRTREQTLEAKLRELIVEWRNAIPAAATMPRQLEALLDEVSE